MRLVIELRAWHLCLKLKTKTNMKTAAITLAVLFATILAANANPSAIHLAHKENAGIHQQQSQFSNPGNHNAKSKTTHPIATCDTMRGRF